MTAESKTYNERFDQRLADYNRDYKIDELNQSNDAAQLRLLINAELTLEAYQYKIEEIIGSEDLIDKANELKKISDLMRDTAETIRKPTQTLAIDRKTRKSEETDLFAGWLRGIKREASNFVEDRLLKIYCKDCKVMVGRWSAVHDHTAFEVKVRCSHCAKWVIAKREDKDIGFDLKNDSDWRRKYPVEIINPTSKSGFSADSFSEVVDDEYIIEGGEFTHGADQEA